MSVSKNQIRYLRSLADKKHREKEGLFIAEGEKICRELLEGTDRSFLEIVQVLAYPEWLNQNHDLIVRSGAEPTEADRDSLARASSLSTPPGVMMVIRIPGYVADEEPYTQDIVPVFEAIRDPGNLGTVIRTADWFGIRQLLCSPDSVDLYNPKCIQASMGAISRVKVNYLPLEPLIKRAADAGYPVYGTLLDGENIYGKKLQSNGLILFGNESRGLSPSLRKMVTEKIRIPEYPKGDVSTESLNVATSAAIIMAEWRRIS